MDISIVDPRNVVALWDNFRYRVRASKPAWILRGRKIHEGIPELADLERAIDELTRNRR